MLLQGAGIQGVHGMRKGGAGAGEFRCGGGDRGS